jgi:hypothetical protein
LIIRPKIYVLQCTLYLSRKEHLGLVKLLQKKQSPSTKKWGERVCSVVIQWKTVADKVAWNL